MNYNKLEALSPLDGRYKNKLKPLSLIFSEYAFFKYRLYVEVEYLIKFLEKTLAEKFFKSDILKIYESFTEEEAEKVKEIESKTNHDVAALIKYIESKLTDKNLSQFVHFGLTSEDVNNIAYGLMLSDAKELYLGLLKTAILKITEFVENYKGLIMLGHTHGEPATPLTLGKDLANYIMRLTVKYQELKNVKVQAKLNGATGSMNALSAVYPEVNWLKFAGEFVESFNLQYNAFATQLVMPDTYVELFDLLKEANSIIVDFSRNIWLYFLLGYMKLKESKESVGSSTMPHKINPIYFENAEGNAEIAENLCSFFTIKLAKSRLQRDISDSTVKRNFGNCFGYSFLALESFFEGLEKLVIDDNKVKEDLENHPEIFSELLQLLLRKKGEAKAYDELKKKTRGQVIKKEEIVEEILKISGDENIIKNYLKGKSEEIVELALKYVQEVFK